MKIVQILIFRRMLVLASIRLAPILHQHHLVGLMMQLAQSHRLVTRQATVRWTRRILMMLPLSDWGSMILMWNHLPVPLILRLHFGLRQGRALLCRFCAAPSALGRMLWLA